MKLIMSKKFLTAAIKAVLPAVPGRPGLPILTGIRLDATTERLTLQTTDLEVTITRTVSDDVRVDRGGSVVAPAKALAKAVIAMPGEEVSLESTTEGERVFLLVSSGARSVTLDGWSPDDWPKAPDPTELPAVASVEASTLAEAFERAALCASADEMRPILTGVALVVTEDAGAVDVVATDSYRLGVVRISFQEPVRTLERPLLIRARVAKALAKQLGGAGGVVRIRHVTPPEDDRAAASPLVGFAFAESAWTVRTIDGEFPNWRQVVPEAEGALFEFDSKELDSALRAAASVRKGRAVSPISLTLDRACSLAVTEPDLGTMKETLAEASFSPNGVGAIQVAFNPDYLADAIRFCGTKRGRMWIREATKAVLFEGPDRSYALMPVRTG